MKTTEIKRFELDADEALEMVGDYFQAHHGVDYDIVTINKLIDLPSGKVVIEVEVEG